MSARASSWAALAAVAAMGLLIAAVAALPQSQVDRATVHYVPAVAAVTLASMAVVVWRVPPAYTLSAALFLSPFAGNWPELGVPGPLSPDRLLLAGGILSVLLRAPPIADRPRLRLSAAHWALALAALYGVLSALIAGTLTDRDDLLKLVDAFGIMPFLVFLVAPLAFRTPQERRVLLVTFVALGAYLGLTTLFETVKLDALVLPKYILDPKYGIHSGRGRGPFVDAVANGLALYTCAVTCAIAATTWRGRGARSLAGTVGLLCVVGTFLCLERSVWIGAALGTCVALLATPRTRRALVPITAVAALAIAAALVLIPGLSAHVTQRKNDKATLWDRKNLARAAVNMVETKPLFGFGWARFTKDSTDYFQQAFDYPLTATKAGVHNTALTYAVELGLVGTTLWAVGLVLGIGSALMTRGPPDLDAWRVGLLAVAAACLFVLNAVPPTTWPNRSLWLLAGVASAGRYLAVDAER
jgi:putative inorganic carbon (HCO3(-)) transporter